MVKHTWYIDISLCWPYRMEDSVLGFVSVPCSASVKLPVNYGNAEYRWMYKRFLRLVFIGQAFKIILGILLKMVNKKFHVAMTLKSSLVAYIYIWTTLRVPAFFLTISVIHAHQLRKGMLISCKNKDDSSSLGESRRIKKQYKKAPNSI